MENQVARGLIETKCENELQEKGYFTWRAKDKESFAFGLFNILALGGDDILFICCRPDQLDVNETEATRKLKMPPGCKREIWHWINNKWHKEQWK